MDQTQPSKEEISKILRAPLPAIKVIKTVYNGAGGLYPHHTKKDD